MLYPIKNSYISYFHQKLRICRKTNHPPSCRAGEQVSGTFYIAIIASWEQKLRKAVFFSPAVSIIIDQNFWGLKRCRNTSGIKPIIEDKKYYNYEQEKLTITYCKKQWMWQGAKKCSFSLLLERATMSLKQCSTKQRNNLKKIKTFQKQETLNLKFMTSV